MFKSITFLATILVSTIAIFAGDLSPAEKEFFDKHSTDLVRLEPKTLDDPALTKVFSTSFYAVKIVISQPDGDMSQDIIAARIGDKLVSVSRPGTDSKLPELVKMFKPDFRLKTDDDAKTLQQALDIAYPIIGEDDKKAKAIKHDGTKWTLVRGVFFDSKLGYIFQTDADGKITSAEFMLKLP